MKRIVTIICGMAVLSMFSWMPKAGGFEDTGETVVMYMGEVKLFPVSNLRRVAVGNPQVVDVINVGKAEFTLVPKTAGSTTLTVWDSFGEQGFRVRVFPQDTRDLKEQVDVIINALGFNEVYTKASDENSKILILGRVKTPQDKERIATALDVLKDKVFNLVEVKEDESVVGIDVQVLELNRDATTSLGFSWPGSIELTEVGSRGIQAAGSKWSTLFSVLNGTRAAFTLKLDALIQEGKARVLSRPRLSCQSAKEAELMVGGEKPNLTTNLVSGSTSQTTSIEYKQFGIKLKIKPTVTELGRIKLAVNVEVSDVEEAVILGTTLEPTAKAFPLTKRTASTELYLDDGQTLSIGGLIKQKTEEDLRRMPWLSDVPVLGIFFRQKEIKVGGGEGERGETELFITITPTIVSGDARSDAAAAAQKKAAAPAVVLKVAPRPMDPVTGYAAIIQKRIHEKLVYPSGAKQSGFQGVVGLAVHLSYTGKLLEVEVKSSSGYSVLDTQALNVVKEFGSFPPFPPAIKNEDIWIDIPVQFKLE